MKDLHTVPNLVALFFARAARRGDAPFLWAKADGRWQPWSWTAAAREVARLAEGLAHIGIGPGDRVMLVCENRPNPKKMAVISDLWSPTHSVYRNYYKYLESLRGAYHLTFFHCLRTDGLDFGLFDEVHRLEFRDLTLDVERLRQNDFAVVYFPDVGMTLTSIMLANYRIAPIQLCSHCRHEERHTS